MNNHLFDLARKGDLRLPPSLAGLYPFLAIIYALIAPIMTSVLISLPLALFLLLANPGQVSLDELLGSGVGLAAVLVTGFGPIFLLVWLWLYAFERRPLWTVGLEAAGWISKYIRGFLWGVVMIGIVVGIPALLGYMRFEGSDLGLTPALISALILLPGWVVQGAAEEVLFRGFLFQVVGVRWGLKQAVLISALLFALLHIFNLNISLLAFLNLALFGAFAAVYAVREGGLWGVFALHSAWNWAQSNLFGMEVSGLPMRLGAIFHLKETGPDWVTGGSFGPEGGVVVTIVLVGGILLLTGFRIFQPRR